jgi:hypothetical protein
VCTICKASVYYMCLHCMSFLLLFVPFLISAPSSLILSYIDGRATPCIDDARPEQHLRRQ